MRAFRSRRRTYRLEISPEHRGKGHICKMTVFSVRSPGYKVGVVLLFLGASACLWGYAAPHWTTVDLRLDSNISSLSNLDSNMTGTTVNEGLWTYCIPERYGDFKCRSYDFEGYPIWFHISRALASVGLLGLLLAVLRALATNCCTDSVHDSRSRVLELLAGFFGLIMAGGCGVYAYFRSVTDSGSTPDSPSEALWVFHNLQDYTFSWAFYLATAGSGVSIIAAIIIGVFNKHLLEASRAKRGNPDVFTVEGHWRGQSQGQLRSNNRL